MLGHQRSREVRQHLILAQAPEATSPQGLLMPRGRQLDPGLVAAGICVPREQHIGLAQESLKSHFKQIPQKQPPLETQQHLLAPLPQLLLARLHVVQFSKYPSAPNLSCMEGQEPGPRGRPRMGSRRSMCPKGAPDRGETQG